MPRQKSFYLFLSMPFIQSLNVFIVSNIKPCQTQLVLNCILLQPLCLNHTKWVGFIFSEGVRTSYLPGVLFCHKNVEKSLRKTISNMAKVVKTFRKNIKMFQQKHTKKGKYYFIDFYVKTQFF